MGQPWGVVYVCRHCGVRVHHVFRLPNRDEPSIRWHTVRSWGCGPCFERRVEAATARREAEEGEAARIAAGEMIHDGRLAEVR